jgi:hypothetical protein
MTTPTLALTALLVAAAAGPALAQTPPAAPQPGTAPRARAATPPAEPRSATPPAAAAPAAPSPRPRREGQAVNVKIEFTLSDQRGTAPPVKRTLSITVADGQVGQIRSQSEVIGIGGGIPLNVDTTPDLLSDGKIRLGFNLQYDWAAPLDAAAPPVRGTLAKTAMHDSVSLILESGKSMIAAQSADPIGDRQVTVEVKATVLR